MALVLIVEDDPVTSAILARGIERGGHTVEIAKNGLQAIDLLESAPFRVLVTDLEMPRLDGQELCDLVRAEERHRDLPILITTGVVEPERLAWTRSVEGVEVIAKPIRIADIVKRIDELTRDRA